MTHKVSPHIPSQPFWSYAFRPFFLFGSVTAAALPLLLALELAGFLELNLLYDPVTYHAHELIFGFILAVIAGFLLTAISNWTGRPPVHGKTLKGLVLLWLLGRAGIFFSGYLGAEISALLDLLFPVGLSLLVWRELIAGKNKRNIPVGVITNLFVIVDLVWHWQAIANGYPALASHMGILLTVILIALIGGRIIPAFTNNWFKRHQKDIRIPEFNGFDKISMVVLILCFIGWLTFPDKDQVLIPLFIGTALLHFLRLLRWRFWETARDPLLLILHLAYAWLPLALLLIGLSIWNGDIIGPNAALHALNSGLISTMVMAMITRVTLGHTGRPLHADKTTVVIYGLVLTAAFLRIYGPILSVENYELVILSSSLCWMSGYLLFAVHYGAKLIQPAIKN